MRNFTIIAAMVLTLVFAVGIPYRAMAASGFGPNGIYIDTHTGSAVMDHTNQFGGDKARNSLRAPDKDADTGGNPFKSTFGPAGGRWLR